MELTASHPSGLEQNTRRGKERDGKSDPLVGGGGRTVWLQKDYNHTNYKCRKHRYSEQ